ncbi:MULTISPECIES: N-acetylmuramoyl-L-alanine amidase CwlD [Bacillus]|jgi:N-acetylmuramoyl-L-alanine amidase|uniref:N-acetylmuramoyl-L-alanine amidase n=2 Tax=Bacillus amyloliquefaciens TaxID=1390 RepID=A0A9P1JE65_BACAS|nr:MULTISPECIES: N-acetylmuramoyl-L-alanine amidase CwlD [Bacillus amyloliquefaciens group]AIW32269.1 N-acetylmuramoyl-L-alanine amidase [Bacillus subtilis]HBO5952119.1 N-acetylmuramoyl-L-alanine amidase CwlD [Pseudomonas aeruginosa]AEB22346.1 N-acetylmuramoyl-L-alanine amidase [Bacillus amyloliquefaciens TA208]AEB61705.1 N-acetylmuramoyl-L-alanine amidase [Bacillus amyloliquefaciens LL3]AEK87305.1 N-acetylmuramoyl-L-alanine amidase [Bacillus amyloliquefaciens XH7]
MRNKLKWLGFLLGFIILLCLFRFQFHNDDSWRPWSLPLSGKIIYLDPGHGGPDGGATGSNHLEKDITLEVASRVRDYLQEQGALVIMTRETDTDLAPEGMKGYSRRKAEDLRKRVEIINRSEAELYISIHLNAIPSPKWSGAQSFYYGKYEENEKVAKYIQDELRINLENTTRKAKRIHGIYLMQNVTKPGALVEVGFLSNPAEAKRLSQPKYQDKIASSVYKGVLRYFTEKGDPPE